MYKTMKTGQERMMADRIRRNTATSIESSAAEDPRIAEAQKQLGLVIADFMERHPGINRRNARELECVVNDFRNTYRRKGIELPRMRCVYFVRMNHICVWPAELEHAELQKRLHLFITHRQRHGRAVDAEDMAMGVRRAYPDYSPSRSNLILPESFKRNQQEIVQ